MSHNSIRKETTCLNCYNPNVKERFCPKCGQENIESRLSVRGVVFHFFEDLTHYDSAFFKTIRYLLFHPAKLTTTYLSGRRKLYVPPIKLYFFISFITFFLASVLPEISNNPEDDILIRTEVKNKNENEKQNIGFSFLGSGNYKSVKELDSVQKTLPQNKKMGSLKYNLLKRIIASNENKDPIELRKKFNTSFDTNLPKAIFIYLPIFGFWLWLFHGKKRWYFFDHAVFTFHYFGFLLLILTISITFFERAYSLIPNENIYDNVSLISGIITCSWIIIYFYIAHKRMYQETKMMSFLKSTALVVINITLMVILMIGLAIYSIINIH